MPIALDEYLHASYEIESEFVDGDVIERHAGMRSHSLCLSNLMGLLHESCKFVWPILRVQTGPSRVRVPDLCVTETDFQTCILHEPPFLCLEILSLEDELMFVIEKCEEYTAFGVPEVWAVDPWRFRIYRFENGLLEVPRLSVPSAGIDLCADTIFEGLNPRP